MESRAARLLALIQALRRRRRPAPAANLAAELNVSLRTIYRDIATLVEQGAPIEGEAGLGYVLKPGFFLPPLMLEDDEVDALILGLRLVAERGDEELEIAAENALAKIEAMLPPAREDEVATSGLLAGPAVSAGERHLAAIRQSLRAEHKLRLQYVDKKGAATERVVWPVAVGFFAGAEVLAAWCETRGDFRHFRLDRIAALVAIGERYPRRRRILFAQWRAQEEIG